MGRPGISISYGGLVSLMNTVFNVCFSVRGSFSDIQETTSASAPFVMQHSVAWLYFIITGRPTHNDRMPGKWSVAVGGLDHITFCIGKGTLCFWDRLVEDDDWPAQLSADGIQ